MLVDGAIEKMTEVVQSAARRFNEIGLITAVEIDYLNAFLQSLKNKQQARFIAVSVVIRAYDAPDGSEYCLSLGAEVRGGRVDDGQLDKDIISFEKLVEETVSMLDTATSKAECISKLAEEASNEYEKLIKKNRTEEKKQRIISTIGVIITIIGLIALFAAATLG